MSLHPDTIQHNSLQPDYLPPDERPDQPRKTSFSDPTDSDDDEEELLQNKSMEVDVPTARNDQINPHDNNIHNTVQSNATVFKDATIQVDLLKPADVKYLYDFPSSLDRRLRSFDDKFIDILQHPDNIVAKFWNLFITAITAIETGIAAPYTFFVFGYDGFATELAFLILVTAIGSQVPKRFLWRPRPYMVGRAIKRRTDKTSSFPSRAGTLSVVYSFALCYWRFYVNGRQIEFWMPFFILGLWLATFYSRVWFGVHYPSDMIAGGVLGVIYCILGTTLYKADVWGLCQTCGDGACYATDSLNAITVHSIGRIPVEVIIPGIVLSCIFVVIAVVPPISFWSKADHVLGMILPCIVFQVGMLCPHGDERVSLPPPPNHLPWYAAFWALGFSGMTTAVGMQSKSIFNVWTFILIYFTVLLSLIAWRVVIQ